MKYAVIQKHDWRLKDPNIPWVSTETVGVFCTKDEAQKFLEECQIGLKKCSDEFEQARLLWQEYKIFELENNHEIEPHKRRSKNRELSWKWFRDKNPPSSNLRKFFYYDYYVHLDDGWSDSRNLKMKDYFSFSIEEEDDDVCISNEPIFTEFENKRIPE